MDNGNGICKYCGGPIDTAGNCYNQECIAAHNYEIYNSAHTVIYTRQVDVEADELLKEIIRIYPIVNNSQQTIGFLLKEIVEFVRRNHR